MAVETAFADLQHQVAALQDALEALGVTADEDRPAQDDVILTAQLSDELLAVRGLLEGALMPLDEARHAAAFPFDAARARHALAAFQQRFQLFAHAFSFDLASHDRLDDLANLGRERGREWAGWLIVVKQGLEQCKLLTEQVVSQLFLCWQELADRMAAGSVSICNTAIGQQVTGVKPREQVPNRDATA